MRNFLKYLPQIFLIFVILSCGRSYIKNPIEKDKNESKDKFENAQIVVFGDSLSTGAVTSSDFYIGYEDIASRILNNKKFNVDKNLLATKSEDITPLRLNGGERDQSNWFAGVEESMSKRFLDVIETPEYAWSNQLALSHNISSSKVVISARNGALVSNFETQVEQFLEKSNKTLPPHVYVFFSGNDLCRKEDNAQASTPTPEFEKGLREGLKKLNEVTQKGDSLPVIHLVSYLDITQLLNILGKTIEVKDMQGKRKLSCDSFINEYYQKKSNKNEELVNQVIRANSYHPMNMCFNVLSNAKSTPATDKSAHIQILKNQIQSYREALKKVATTSQDLTNLKLQVETGTEKLVVEEKDMANDCFHLSFDGQKKLAQAIARSN